MGVVILKPLPLDNRLRMAGSSPPKVSWSQLKSLPVKAASASKVLAQTLTRVPCFQISRFEQRTLTWRIMLLPKLKYLVKRGYKCLYASRKETQHLLTCLTAPTIRAYRV